MRRPNRIPESPGPDEFGNRYGLKRPPELTAEIASRRWRELNRLLHSVMVLHTLRGERRPFHRILRTAGTLVGASRGILYRHGAADGVLDMAAFSGFPEGVPEGRQSVNEMAFGALRIGKPALVHQPEDARLQEELRLLGEPSGLTVPIFCGGQPWGAIQILRPEPFDEDEAVLLWIYAIVLEDALPSVTEASRTAVPLPAATRHPALVGLSSFRAKIDWEMECALWAGRSCSVLRLTWQAEEEEGPGALRQGRVLRVIRRSLRPADLMAPEPDGSLLVFLPEAEARDAEQVGQGIRRNLIQSRVMGDEGRVVGSLRITHATGPEQGRRSEELLRALTS